jgi:UDP-N-acetylmuramoyl-L-alanyl-D-glutamate--2,6-diaminopimelate ligase
MKVTTVQVITYGIEKPADVRARRIEISPHGTRFLLETFQGNCEIQLRLIGKFNVYNVLAAISVALAEGIPLAQIKKSVESVSGVNGRFEPVNAGQPFAVIVDYAHTPDSLENVLKTIQEFAKKRVFCVVGCGGDRDRGKRPLMARIAATYSDRVFLTSDNPRTEDPQRILEDMLAGIKDVDPGRYQVIVDRKEAIEKAIQEAQAGDVVLIAGKGHETYQEINGVRYDFDDREVARQAIMRDANGT